MASFSGTASLQLLEDYPNGCVKLLLLTQAEESDKVHVFMVLKIWTVFLSLVIIVAIRRMLNAHHHSMSGATLYPSNQNLDPAVLQENSYNPRFL